MLAYMSLWFALSCRAGRYDVVDTAWGLGFIVVAWFSVLLTDSWGLVAIVSAALVSVWGIRLAGHIASRNLRKSHDDHRYQELRAKWGGAAQTKAFTHIFLLQGALIVCISAPVLAIALAPSAHPTVFTWAGWAIWVFGIAFEAIADWQLRTFLSHRAAGSHQPMTDGLWRYSRHPNYFGEIVTWWGAALVAVSTGGWWGIIGAATITILITKVSGIPPLEKHYVHSVPYQTYARTTSLLIPLPRRK